MLKPSQTVLENIAPVLIERLKKAQLDRGLKATGRSADSLEFTVANTGSVWRLEILGASWWYYQQHGRGPNRKPGKPGKSFVEIIRNWIRVKNLSIPLAAAYPIANKIYNKGYQVPNQWNRGGVLSEPLAKDKIIDLLVPDLKASYLSYLRALKK